MQVFHEYTARGFFKGHGLDVQKGAKVSAAPGTPLDRVLSASRAFEGPQIRMTGGGGDQNETIKALEQRVAGLAEKAAGEITGLRAEIDTLRGQVSSLEASLAESQDALGAAQAEIEDLRKKLAEVSVSAAPTTSRKGRKRGTVQTEGEAAGSEGNAAESAQEG